MKPIRLEFCGLHSYCTHQDIDFAWLGDNGLFGIFGPTGAGKSTILDAMTLALYGNVERASKGTQGIIHQNCDKLDVRFEFALGEERYQVEQHYQRAKDDPQGVSSKKSLLCHFDPQSGRFIPEVEKITEVKAAIQKLIGLTEEEFTRAVVLPQGKFDAFLSLKGKDKSAMLENIFNLGCFGQRIFEKASRAREQAAGRKRELEGEARGLGECSLSILESRREEKSRLIQQVEELKKNLEKLRQEEEQQRRIKGWAEEKVHLERQKKNLEEQAGAIRQKEERIALAEKAERCRRDLEMLRELQEARKKEAISLARQQKALEEQQFLYQKCEETQRSTCREKEEKLPGLYTLRERLENCLAIHEQYKEKQKEQARQQGEYNRITNQFSQADEDLTRNQQRWNAEQERLKKITEEIDKNAVSPDQKRIIRDAYQQLRLLEEKTGCLARETAGLQKILDEQKLAERQWLKAIQGHIKASASWSAVSSPPPLPLDMTPQEVEIRVEEEKRHIQEVLEECEKALDLIKLRNEGTHLAMHLKEGVPCPVCGSLEHPAPALAEGLKEEMIRLEAQKKTWQEEQKKLSQFELRLAKMTASLSGGRKEIEKQQEKVNRLQEEVRAFEDELRRQMPDLGPDEIRSRYELLSKQEEEAALLQEQQRKQAAVLEELRQKIDQGRQKKEELGVRHSALQSTLSSLAQGVLDLERSIREVTQGRPIRALIQENEAAIASLEKRFQEAEKQFRQSEKRLQELNSGLDTIRGKLETLAESEESTKSTLDQRMREEAFASIQAVEDALMDRKDLAGLQQNVKNYHDAVLQNEARLASVADKLEGQVFDPAAYTRLVQHYESVKQQVDADDKRLAVVGGELEKLEKSHLRWQEIEKEIQSLDRRINRADELARLLRGRALVTFLSHEYLEYMCREASECLRFLTRERYSLRVDQDNNFFMIDCFNGGKERPVSTLSGGETFLTALSLALALSSQVQSRGKSQHLGFFFLDEGFGTLDAEKLDLVMNTLERLRSPNRIVGIISHVQELRERMPRYLEVFPARSDGTGSRIKLSGQ